MAAQPTSPKCAHRFPDSSVVSTFRPAIRPSRKRARPNHPSPPEGLTTAALPFVPSAPTRRHVGDAAHEPGGHQVRGVLRPGAQDGGELSGAVRERLLRRHRLPPQHQGLHDPGRRPHRHRQGRRVHLGQQVRRRVQGVGQAQRAGDHVHGQQRAQHQRQPVLHHLRQAAAPQRPLHRLRQGHPRLRGPRPHGEDAHGARGPPARRDQAQPCHHPRQSSRRIGQGSWLVIAHASMVLAFVLALGGGWLILELELPASIISSCSWRRLANLGTGTPCFCNLSYGSDLTYLNVAARTC